MIMDTDLPLARRDLIASRLAAGAAVSASALAAEFDVSEDAIRRDLRALASEGKCRRVYGGALPIARETVPLSVRADHARDEKHRLARAASRTVQAGELVFIDTGSTNLALVDLLPEDAGIVVATNAVEIAAATLRRQDLPLIVIGGSADPVIGGCVDGAATAAVAQMRIDRAFIGACSVSPSNGVGAFHFADATFKRTVHAVSRRTLVLATADKIADDAHHLVARLDEIDALVIDQPAARHRPALEAGGCRNILVADRD